MTNAQRTFLECVRDFGGNGEGWAEIELQYESRRIPDDMPSHLVPSIIKRVGGACEVRGWVTRDADGPSLTESGRSALASEEALDGALKEMGRRFRAAQGLR